MHCVDLGESFQTHIYLQNLAWLQPRTYGPCKVCRIPRQLYEVRELDLPRGLVYNMDEDGEPIDLSGFGPVFIKYNSGTGSARLSRCPGQFRGVYFTPDLGDGVFRQMVDRST